MTTLMLQHLTIASYLLLQEIKILMIVITTALLAGTIFKVQSYNFCESYYKDHQLHAKICYCEWY